MGCCNAKGTSQEGVVTFDSGTEESNTLNFKGFFKTSNDTLLSPRICSTVNTKSGNSKTMLERIPSGIKTDQNKFNKEEFEKTSSVQIEEEKCACAGYIPKIPFPMLIIEVNNSKISFTDTIYITPNSINSSQGCIIKKPTEKFTFGRNDTQCATGSILPKNDYTFSDEGMATHQFEICFKDDAFYLTDNKSGTGIFIKIKDKAKIDHDMIISFCSSHMMLQLEISPPPLVEKMLKIRFLKSSHPNREKCFRPSIKSIIKIGRSKDADIIYTDESVSRVQCTLSYENDEWVINDGQMGNGSNRLSANGLWLLPSHKIEIVDHMTLKSGSTCLNVKVIKNENEKNEKESI